MTVHTKKAIENVVNRLLLGSGYNNRRSTGGQKPLRALWLGNNEDKKTQEERSPLKVWKMMTPEARIAMRSGEEVDIVLVRDSGTEEVKRGLGKMSKQHKKVRDKLLQMTHSEGKKMTPLI